MTKAEAREHLGRPVTAWTASRGTYIGILEKIAGGQPFRAVVRVLAVLELPMEPRAHLREVGELIEVGAVNAKPWPSEVPSWNQTVLNLCEAQLQRVAHWRESRTRDESRRTVPENYVQLVEQGVEKWIRRAREIRTAAYDSEVTE